MPKQYLFIMVLLFFVKQFSVLSEDKETEEVILFSDNFEKGLNSNWVIRGDVEIKPEFPDKPDMNKVAVLDRSREMLKYELSKVEQQNNYTVTFRFRLASFDEPKPVKEQAVDDIFAVLWNQSPIGKKPKEHRYVKLQAWLWKPYLHWRFSTPFIWWIKKPEKYEKVMVNKRLITDKSIDTQWHTLKIVSKNVISELYLDDTLYFKGDDLRAFQGDFEILYSWRGHILPTSPLYIDDVKITSTVEKK